MKYLKIEVGNPIRIINKKERWKVTCSFLNTTLTSSVMVYLYLFCREWTVPCNYIGKLLNILLLTNTVINTRMSVTRWRIIILTWNGIINQNIVHNVYIKENNQERNQHAAVKINGNTWVVTSGKPKIIINISKLPIFYYKNVVLSNLWVVLSWVSIKIKVINNHHLRNHIPLTNRGKVTAVNRNMSN